MNRFFEKWQQACAAPSRRRLVERGEVTQRMRGLFSRQWKQLLMDSLAAATVWQEGAESLAPSRKAVRLGGHTARAWSGLVLAEVLERHGHWLSPNGYIDTTRFSRGVVESCIVVAARTAERVGTKFPFCAVCLRSFLVERHTSAIGGDSDEPYVDKIKHPIATQHDAEPQENLADMCPRDGDCLKVLIGISVVVVVDDAPLDGDALEVSDFRQAAGLFKTLPWALVFVFGLALPAAVIMAAPRSAALDPPMSSSAPTRNGGTRLPGGGPRPGPPRPPKDEHESQKPPRPAPTHGSGLAPPSEGGADGHPLSTSSGAVDDGYISGGASSGAGGAPFGPGGAGASVAFSGSTGSGEFSGSTGSGEFSGSTGSGSTGSGAQDVVVTRRVQVDSTFIQRLRTPCQYGRYTIYKNAVTGPFSRNENDAQRSARSLILAAQVQCKK